MLYSDVVPVSPVLVYILLFRQLSSLSSADDAAVLVEVVVMEVEVVVDGG